MWVVHRVHGAAALVGLLPEPAAAAGLADHDVLVLGVAHGTQGGVALAVDTAQFAAGQAHDHVVAFLALHLHAGAGAAGQLRALAGHEFQRVDHGAHRHEAQRQGVAQAGFGLGTGVHGGAHGQALGGQDVALLAVGVVQQGDAGAAVGIVLDGGDLGGHARLVTALEVDDAVQTLVPAADEAAGDAATVVASAGLGQRFGERLLGALLGQSAEVRRRHLAT